MYDGDCCEDVPEAALAALAPPPEPMPEPEPVLDDVAPPRWVDQRRKLMMLVGGGVLFPALLIGLGIGLAWLLRREPLWRQLTQVTHPLWLLWAVPVALGSTGLLHLLTKLVPAVARALKETGATDHRETIRLLGYSGLLLLVITSGLGEEVLFRGGLQPTITIPVAAFLFGFAHGGWHKRMWAYVLAAALAGCLYGVVYWYTQMLWIAMLAHALHNTLSVLLAGKKVKLEFERWRLRVCIEPDPELAP